jgi:large subunit ribosomal protein L24
MKKTTSTQARKQRKWLAKAPAHARGKMMSCALDKELKTQYKRNSLPVRKGDKVKVMRGDHKGHQGEVMNIDRKKYKIYVQGITATKSDGKVVEKAMAPSNVMITALNEEDKQRRETLNKTAEAK